MSDAPESRVGQWADHVSGQLDPRRVTRDEGDLIWLEFPSGDEAGPLQAANYRFYPDRGGERRE